MTDDELAELERLANAATPGPWSSRHGITTASVVHELSGTVASCMQGPLGDDATDREHGNAAFIASARSAVPALIKELRERRELDYSNMPETIKALRARIAELEDEIETHEATW